MRWHFNPAAKDIWINAGLRRRDAKLAFEILEAGLGLNDLGMEIDGFTVAYRLTHGESLDWICNRLRRSN